MTRDETIALFLESQKAANPHEVWNAWANGVLEEKKRLETNGIWAEYEKHWENTARVDFFEVDIGPLAPESKYSTFLDFVFPGKSNFNRAIFGKPTRFDRASFGGFTNFSGAKFHFEANFSNSIYRGELSFMSTEFSGVAWFLEAKFDGFANFYDAKFATLVHFMRCSFGGFANFHQCKFGGETRFVGVQFAGLANFELAVFSERTDFGGAIFRGDAVFEDATFSGTANFSADPNSPNFSQEADFSFCKFGEAVSFDGRHFKENANFRSVRSERSFSMAECVFDAVPNFLEAGFHASPRLDNLRISERFVSPEVIALGSDARIVVEANGNLDGVSPSQAEQNALSEAKRRMLERSEFLRAELAARYRALRKMAKDAEYHGLELDMFAGELSAERAASLKRLGGWENPMVWFSIGYEMLCDYGRSFMLPLGWWLLVMGASFVAFMAFADLGLAQSQFCLNSGGQPWSALVVSAQKSLLSFGIGRGDALDSQLYCLFGVSEVQTGAAGRTITAPALPPAYTIIVLLQTVASGALLFLFFLGVRNRFRIK